MFKPFRSFKTISGLFDRLNGLNGLNWRNAAFFAVDLCFRVFPIVADGVH
jgi:hypothetical protein